MTQVMARRNEGGHNESVTEERETQREQLLRTKVAHIITAHPDALSILINGGFSPLQNPVMRAALANTVNLRQAFQIRALSNEQEEAIISELLQLGAAWE